MRRLALIASTHPNRVPGVEDDRVLGIQPPPAGGDFVRLETRGEPRLRRAWSVAELDEERVGAVPESSIGVVHRRRPWRSVLLTR